jgi:serine/threonine protein kinase
MPYAPIIQDWAKEHQQEDAALKRGSLDLQNHGYLAVTDDDGDEVILGRGVSGVVILVRDSKGVLRCDKRQRILKLGDRERYQKEVDILQTLSHPNIVRAFGAFMPPDGSRGHLILEFADGGSLQARIQRAQESGVGFSEADIRGCMVPLLSAVAYLHERRLVHGDLKPGNVLLTSSGVVKLADFGTCSKLDAPGTRLRGLFCSPLYISPELCLDLMYDEKHDVWALGAMLYLMATLQDLLNPALYDPKACDQVQLMTQVLSLPEPVVVPDAVCPEIRTLIQILLAKDPEERPSLDTVLQLPHLKAVLEAPVAPNDAPLRMPAPEEVEREKAALREFRQRQVKEAATQEDDDDDPVAYLARYNDRRRRSKQLEVRLLELRRETRMAWGQRRAARAEHRSPSPAQRL